MGWGQAPDAYNNTARGQGVMPGGAPGGQYMDQGGLQQPGGNLAFLLHIYREFQN